MMTLGFNFIFRSVHSSIRQNAGLIFREALRAAFGLTTRNREEEEMAATFCSFCSREVSPQSTECPWCGVSFHTEILSLLTDDFPEAPQEEPAAHRRHVRVPQSYKVAYFSRQDLAKSYLSDISLGGLFIATNDPLDQGETVTLKIFLPDKGRELEVLGEVAWSSREERVTPERTHPPGMGVRFLHLSIEDRIRIGTNILEY
jgi:uncharacterized protein (TIGR02266 family)